MRLPPHLPRIAALAATLMAAALAHAADESIVTDRPDFVESSDVVGAGRFQLETGLTADRHTQGGLTDRSLTTPTLFRYGIGQTTELRLETDGWTHIRSGDAPALHGMSDVSLGIKWHVMDGAGSTPGVAWLLHVDTPSGSRTLRGVGLRPSLRAAIEWDLPEDFSVGIMPGVYMDRDESGRRFAGGIFAVTLGKEWSPRWHSFVELAGQQLVSRRHGGAVATLDAGLAFVATPTLQFDVEVARGLSDAAPDLESGVGVAIKF